MQDRKDASQSDKKKRLRKWILWEVIILVILIILLLLLHSCGKSEIPGEESESPKGNYEVYDNPLTKPTEPKETGPVPMITFAGYGGCIVSERAPTVMLQNPKGNTVSMVFKMTDKATGEVIAQTEKIGPDKFVYIDVMDFYTEAGVYDVLINTSTYDLETDEPRNGLNQEMKITVIE